MPQMTMAYDPNDGILIEVEFRCPGTPSVQTAPVTLMVDTGARRTHVTSQIADFFQLPLRGQRRVVTADSSRLMDTWTTDIVIPALPMTFPDILVTDFLTPNRNYAGVLGRDILSNGVLHVDGPNRTVTLGF